MALIDHDIKQPNEGDIISIDLSSRLIDGETISSHTVTSRIEETGTDSTAALIANESITDGIVSIQYAQDIITDDIHSQPDGEIHVITVSFNTNYRNGLEEELRVIIREE